MFILIGFLFCLDRLEVFFIIFYRVFVVIFLFENCYFYFVDADIEVSRGYRERGGRLGFRFRFFNVFV